MNANEPYLQEAIRIGDELARQAKSDQHGVFWINITEVHSRYHVVKKANTTIGNGTSGIILFLLELHAIAPKDEYFQLIKQGGNWLIACSKTTETSSSLLAGELGAAFVLSRIYALTREPVYIAHALELARNVNFAPDTKTCFLHGYSGAIYMLLHLYNITPQPWIISQMELCVGRLMEQALPTEHGVYWNKLSGEYGGPTGIYGTSGVAVLLYDLSKVLQAPGLEEIAIQTLEFNLQVIKQKSEQLSCYHPIFHYFKRISVQGHTEMQYHQIVGVLCAGEQMLSSNDRISSVSSIQQIMNEAYSHFRTTQRHYSPRHATLSSGKFLELNIARSSKETGNNISLTAKIVRTLKSKLINRSKNIELRKTDYPASLEFEDYGLFRGSTGWGYYCLCRHNSSFIPFLQLDKKLSPVTKDEHLSIRIDENRFTFQIYQQPFVRTWAIMRQLNYEVPVLTSQTLKNYADDLHQCILKFNNACLLDVFQYERNRIALAQKIPFLFTRSYPTRNSPAKADLMQSKNRYLILGSDTKLLKTKWNWNGAISTIKENINKSHGSHYTVVALAHHELIELTIDHLKFLLLTQFEKKKKDREAIKYVMKQFSGLSPEHKKSIEDQCQEALSSFFKLEILKSA